MAHFVGCVLNDKQPLIGGEGGRVVMRTVIAAYQSARKGRRVEWPYEVDKGKTPVEVWGREGANAGGRWGHVRGDEAPRVT